jgi:hypothetical protein
MKRLSKPITLGEAYATINEVCDGFFDVYVPDVVYCRKTLSMLPSEKKPFDYERWLLRIDQSDFGGELFLYPKQPANWYLFVGILCYPDMPRLSLASVYVMPLRQKDADALEWQKKLRLAFKRAKAKKTKVAEEAKASD